MGPMKYVSNISNGYIIKANNCLSYAQVRN